MFVFVSVVVTVGLCGNVCYVAAANFLCGIIPLLYSYCCNGNFLSRFFYQAQLRELSSTAFTRVCCKKRLKGSLE